MSSCKNSEDYPPHIPDPLNMIEQEQNHLLLLCDRLEEIADSLPDGVPPVAFEKIAQDLRQKLPELHRHLEHALFPVLKKQALPQDDIDEIISGFTHEHAMDEGYVLDVVEVLRQLSSEPQQQKLQGKNYDAAGYLLRGFFEGLRRHLRWERFIVLRLARQRLGNDDLVAIGTQISMENP